MISLEFPQGSAIATELHETLETLAVTVAAKVSAHVKNPCGKDTVNIPQYPRDKVYLVLMFMYQRGWSLSLVDEFVYRVQHIPISNVKLDPQYDDIVKRVAEILPTSVEIKTQQQEIVVTAFLIEARNTIGRREFSWLDNKLTTRVRFGTRLSDDEVKLAEAYLKTQGWEIMSRDGNNYNIRPLASG